MSYTAGSVGSIFWGGQQGTGIVESTAPSPTESPTQAPAASPVQSGFSDTAYTGLLGSLGIADYNKDATRPTWLDAVGPDGILDLNPRENASISSGDASNASYDESAGIWRENVTGRPIKSDEQGFYYGDTFKQDAADAWSKYTASAMPPGMNFPVGFNGIGSYRNPGSLVQTGARDYIMSSLMSGKEVPLNEWLAGNYESNEIIPDNPVSQQIAEQYSSLYGSKPTGQLLQSLGKRLGLSEEEVNRVAGAVAANKYGDNFAQEKSAWNAGLSIAAQDWVNGLIDYAESKGISVDDATKGQALKQADGINQWFQKARHVESHTGGMFGGMLETLGPIAQIAFSAAGMPMVAAGIGAANGIANHNPLGAALSLAGGFTDFGGSFATADAAQLAGQGLNVGQIADTIGGGVSGYANAAIGQLSNLTGLPVNVVSSAIKGALSGAGNGAEGAAVSGLIGGISAGAGNAVGSVTDSDFAGKLTQQLVSKGLSLAQAQQAVNTVVNQSGASTQTPAPTTAPTTAPSSDKSYMAGTVGQMFWS